MLQHGMRVYNTCCDSCGVLQRFGVEGAGLERYDDWENPNPDNEDGYWLLCDTCRPKEEEDDD